MTVEIVKCRNPECANTWELTQYNRLKRYCNHKCFQRHTELAKLDRNISVRKDQK